LGVLELQKGDRPGARRAFERALTNSPASVDVLRYLVKLDLSDRQPAAARARIDGALTRQPGNANLLLLSSETFAAAGQMNDAERVARSVIDQDPNHLEAYALLGRLYVAMNKLEQGTQQFQTLAARQPKSVAVNTVVGVLLQMQNRTSEAQTKFEQVVQMDPRAAVAANNLAWIDAEQGGNLDVALQLAQRAKAKLPNQPEVNDTLGWVYQKKGLSSMAVGPLEQAVRSDPNNGSYLYHLGAAYAGSGDAARARSTLDRAIAQGLSAGDAAAARQLATGLKG